MYQRICAILRFVVGLVFMLSGLLKAIDTATFANLISDYGPVWLGVGAPLVIAIEIFLGVLLIFNLRPRWIATATTVFIVGVSAIYLYGVLFRGITDCGCFGPLTWLNSKPWLTFTRNAVLVALLVPSLLKPQDGEKLTMPIVCCMAGVGVVLMFMCGYSFRGARCMIKESYDTEYHAKPVSESVLSNYYTFHPDSNYLVFAFSYGCPYCQNSVANVNQYKTMGMVDKVVGLAVEDPKGRERFDRIFDIDFEIHEISELQMVRLTNTLPTVFRIRHDSIVNSYTGLVISPALLIP